VEQLEIRYKGKRDNPKKTDRNDGKQWIYYQKIDNIIGSTVSAAYVSASCQAASEASTADIPLLAPDSDMSAGEERAAATGVESQEPQPAMSKLVQSKPATRVAQGNDADDGKQSKRKA